MVKDYPQLTIRVPPETRARLAALSTVRGLPQWRIVVDALASYLREQSDDDRRLLDELTRTFTNRRTPRDGHG